MSYAVAVPRQSNHQGEGVLARGWWMLIAAIVFSVLAFGATLPWGMLVLEWMVLISGVAVFAGRDWRQPLALPEIAGPMALFASVVLVQLALHKTAYWAATYQESLLFLAYATAVLTAAHAFRRDANLRSLAWTLVVFGTLYALFSILQQLTGTDKLYGVLKPREAFGFYGSYANHNHYAGLMEMLTPFPLVLAFSAEIHGRFRMFLLFCGALMGASLLMSMSRGGTIAFCIEMILLALLLSGGKRSSRYIGIAAAGAAVLALAAWIAADQLIARWSEPISDPIRSGVLRDAPHMFTVRPLLGWGLGTFPTVYPHFRSYVTEYFVNQAHNDVLQVLLETGLVGFAAMAWFLFIVYRRGLASAKGRRDFGTSVRTASLIGCTGLLIHSFTDFNLHIPANALVFFTLAGVASIPSKTALPFRRPSGS